MYPYFEKDVEGLREKNYIVPEEGAGAHWEAWAAGLRGSGDAAVKERAATKAQ
jgi:hypothetical protein